MEPNKEPRDTLHECSKLTCDKEAKAIHGEKVLFPNNESTVMNLQSLVKFEEQLIL